MSELRWAARKGDFISHDWSQGLRMAGFVAWTIAAAKYLAVPLMFTPAGAAAFAAAVIIDWYVSGLIQDGLDRVAMEMPRDKVPRIAQGSPNVFVNGLEAARRVHRLECQRHGLREIAQGSEWVYINTFAAARWKDRTNCRWGAFLTKNPAIFPENVQFGGPPTSYDNVHPAQALAQQLWPLFSLGFSRNAAEAAQGATDYLGTEITTRALDAIWR